MPDTYAHVFQRGRRFAVRVIEHDGQFVDSHEAETLRAVAIWLADYHPTAKLAPASPACAIRENVA